MGPLNVRGLGWLLDALASLVAAAVGAVAAALTVLYADVLLRVATAAPEAIRWFFWSGTAADIVLLAVMAAGVWWVWAGAYCR